MSKIGRKPIHLSSATVVIKDDVVTVKGPKGIFEHHLPIGLKAVSQPKGLTLLLGEDQSRKVKTLWGLHRALLANKVQGVEKGFDINMKIVGLGFKAQLAGKKLTFTLGFSHKIDYEIPNGVSVAVDKTGQLLTVSGMDKDLVGKTADEIRSLKQPEPYKGTGIIRDGEVILRKAGKAKSAG